MQERGTAKNGYHLYMDVQAQDKQANAVQKQSTRSLELIQSGVKTVDCGRIVHNRRADTIDDGENSGGYGARPAMDRLETRRAFVD